MLDLCLPKRERLQPRITKKRRRGSHGALIKEEGYSLTAEARIAT